MNQDEIYDLWKAEKAGVQVPAGFSSRVMAEIHRCERGKAGGPVTTMLLQLGFLPNKAARAGCVALMMFLGLFRLSTVAFGFLVP